MDPNRRIRQPGPALTPRVLSVPCRAEQVELNLQAGPSLLDAIAEATGGQDAVLELDAGSLKLAYVIPALSQTPANAAFYSEIMRPEGETTVEALRITFGQRAGLPWLHAHGFWRLPDGTRHGGHVIPNETILLRPAQARAWLLHGAGFDAEPDPETGFSLFGPVPRGPPPSQTNAFAVRLRPNQDIFTALESLGSSSATIRGGVASIIGAVFDDGRISENFATEMFIRHGRIEPNGATLDVAMVDYTGALSEGRLLRGANPVLMTAEMVVELH